MHTSAFADLLRRLTAELPRRSLLLSALSTTGVLGMAGLPGGIAAKKRRRRRKKRKVRFNEFGCVNVGMFCRNDGQCCSGICRGKKGKKTCRAHDASTCQAGQQEPACGTDGDPEVLCVTSAGREGVCDTTTGGAPFCLSDGECFPCTRDADCVPFCGPQAACIVCADCLDEVVTATACVGPDQCTFLTPSRGARSLPRAAAR